MRNPKSDILEGLLGDYAVVQVWLDSHDPEAVVLPNKLMKQDAVVLELGLNLPVPINDLYVGDGGFRATLSFDHRPFEVTVLWDAVYMFSVKGEGGVVFDDVRAKRALAGAGLEFDEDEVTEVKPRARRTLPPGWAVIEGGRVDEPSNEPPRRAS